MGEHGGRGLKTSRSLNLQTHKADAAEEELVYYHDWCPPPVAPQGTQRAWLSWARSDRPSGPKPVPAPALRRPSDGLTEGPPSASPPFSSALSHSTWRRAQPPPPGHLGRSAPPDRALQYSSPSRGAASPGFSPSRSAGRAAERAASRPPASRPLAEPDQPLNYNGPPAEYHLITREQTHAFHSSLMEAGGAGGGGPVLTKINMKR